MLVFSEVSLHLLQKSTIHAGKYAIVPWMVFGYLILERLLTGMVSFQSFCLGVSTGVDVWLRGQGAGDSKFQNEASFGWLEDLFALDLIWSKNLPTYPWNIPQAQNQQFMKEFLSFGGWEAWGMLQGYVGVLLDWSNETTTKTYDKSELLLLSKFTDPVTDTWQT